MNENTRHSLIVLSELIRQHLAPNFDVDLDQAYATIVSSIQTQGDLVALSENEEDARWVEQSFHDFLRAFRLTNAFLEKQDTDASITEAVAEAIARNIVGIFDQLVEEAITPAAPRHSTSKNPLHETLEAGLRNIRGSMSDASSSSASEPEQDEWETSPPNTSAVATHLRKPSPATKNKAVPEPKARLPRTIRPTLYTVNDDLARTKDSTLAARLASRREAIEAAAAREVSSHSALSSSSHVPVTTTMPVSNHPYATRQNTRKPARVATHARLAETVQTGLQSNEFLTRKPVLRSTAAREASRMRMINATHDSPTINGHTPQIANTTNLHAHAQWGVSSPEALAPSSSKTVSTTQRSLRSSSSTTTISLNETLSSSEPESPAKRRKLSFALSSPTSPATAGHTTPVSVTPAVSTPVSVSQSSPVFATPRTPHTPHRPSSGVTPLLFNTGLSSPTSAHSSTPVSAHTRSRTSSIGSQSPATPLTTGLLTPTPSTPTPGSTAAATARSSGRKRSLSKKDCPFLLKTAIEVQQAIQSNVTKEALNDGIDRARNRR